MKPAPKIETIIGSTTVSAKSVAIMASTALPPRTNISVPASEARGWFEATTPLAAATSRLKVCRGSNGIGASILLSVGVAGQEAVGPAAAEVGQVGAEQVLALRFD